MLEFFASLHWGAVVQIIVIDLLLGGDNAVVIALACRNLPPEQRIKGVIWGTVGALTLRVVLVGFAVALLDVPMLKLLGGVLLFWIGVKLLLPEQDTHEKIKPADRLWTAIKTIIVADVVMSLDNVIAIAGAADAAHEDHRMLLIIFGLVVSIPIIVWGSQLVLKALDRYPFILYAGAALLGWIGGGLIIADPVLPDWPVLDAYWISWTAGLAGAALVLLIGQLFRQRMRNRPIG